MFRIFILGVILGLGGMAALVYFVPAVDLHREASLISVQPNGGNRETFHINLPQDRILAGSRSGEQFSGFPPALAWPAEDSLDGSSSEAFKLRNTKGKVVGVAVRVSSSRETSGPFIHWMIHLPSRGTIFVGMRLNPEEDGHRVGQMMAGTREYAMLGGNLLESFVTDVDDAEFDISGRIELVTLLVASLGDEE